MPFCLIPSLLILTDFFRAADQAHDTDLVVVLARPRSFWGKLFHNSVTAEVLLHSTVPVLVLPTLA